jgi:fructose-1,6-bisphosphatase II / sedoheptulose-1,7-bisphosphatase
VAVAAMYEAMNKIYMCGRIFIGEKEGNKAPMLYPGEKIEICTQENEESGLTV